MIAVVITTAINKKLTQDMQLALRGLVDSKKWELKDGHVKLWVGKTAAKLRVMMRHIQQARGRSIKWVQQIPFSAEGFDGGGRG